MLVGWPQRWRQDVLLKHLHTLARLHGVSLEDQNLNSRSLANLKTSKELDLFVLNKHETDDLLHLWGQK